MKLVVCYEHDRDELRDHLIKWLQNQCESMDEIKCYRKLLRAYFNLVDKNNDGKLDSTEFTEFIKTNDSIGEVGQIFIVKIIFMFCPLNPNSNQY